MKTEIIPVVVGALGMITKGFEKLIKEIPGKINPWEIQKTALLGTTHIHGRSYLNLEKVHYIRMKRKEV